MSNLAVKILAERIGERKRELDKQIEELAHCDEETRRVIARIEILQEEIAELETAKNTFRVPA